MEHARVLDIYERPGWHFTSLKEAPLRHEQFNRFMETTRNWDRDVQVRFLNELIAKPIGAHYFDHMVATMEENHWDNATRGELMRQAVRPDGCLKYATSTATVAVFKGVVEFEGEPETRSALYRAMACHVHRMVPIAGDAGVRACQHNGENCFESPVEGLPRFWFVEQAVPRMLRDIASFPKDQQAETLKNLARSVAKIETHAPYGVGPREEAQAVQDQCMAMICAHVQDWGGNDKSLADAVRAASRTRHVPSYGELHG